MAGIKWKVLEGDQTILGTEYIKHAAIKTNRMVGID
jgi:hypothetical protein